MKSTPAYPYIVSLLVLVALLTGVGVILAINEKNQRQQATAARLNEMDTSRSRLTEAVLSGVSVTRGIIAFVSSNPDISEQQFELMATELTGLAPVIRNIWLGR